MMIESFRWLAGLIAGHRNRTVFGRDRMQYTVFLLQRFDVLRDFPYSLHFGGPYSDGVFSELRLLQQMGFATEERRTLEEGADPFVYRAIEEAILPEIEPFKAAIALIEATPDLALEHATTYVLFRLLGYDHNSSIERGRWRLAKIWTAEAERQALELLEQLGLVGDECKRFPPPRWHDAGLDFLRKSFSPTTQAASATTRPSERSPALPVNGPLVQTEPLVGRTSSGVPEATAAPE